VARLWPGAAWGALGGPPSLGTIGREGVAAKPAARGHDTPAGRKRSRSHSDLNVLTHVFAGDLDANRLSLTHFRFS
jgi:hypothetical protein